jgi:predicted metal-binding transcription factor (methanogenesis marker protein 9)
MAGEKAAALSSSGKKSAAAGLNMAALKNKAKELGLSNYYRLSKTNLIRAIQLGEGYNDCFGRVAYCAKSANECMFAVPCLVSRKELKQP